MTWRTVKTEEDLIHLNQSNCWDDSSTLEFYASNWIPYIPDDTAYGARSIKILLQADSAHGEILELVFVNVYQASYEYLDRPHFFHSRLDGLKRLHVEPPGRPVSMHCERVAYRYCEELEIHYSGRYFSFVEANAKTG